MGTCLQGLITLCVPTYEAKPWQGTLIVIGVACLAVFFNTFLAKKLPFVEGMMLMLHIVGLFAIMIPLLVLAPRNNATAVFTEFTNNGGWPTKGVSFMVGLNAIVLSLAGFDSTVHMCKYGLTPSLSYLTFLAEETRNAAISLPRTIMWSSALNAVLGFAMVITIVFTWGDMDEIRQTPTLYPFIQVFYNTTQSIAGTSVMTVIVMLMVFASTIAVTATASRQIWSFARDYGVPFPGVVSRVSLLSKAKDPSNSCRSLQDGTFPSMRSSSL